MTNSLFENFRLACLLVGCVYLILALVKGRINSGKHPILRTQSPRDFWTVWGVLAGVFAVIMFVLFRFF